MAMAVDQHDGRPIGGRMTGRRTRPQDQIGRARGRIQPSAAAPRTAGVSRGQRPRSRQRCRSAADFPVQRGGVGPGEAAAGLLPHLDPAIKPAPRRPAARSAPASPGTTSGGARRAAPARTSRPSHHCRRSVVVLQATSAAAPGAAIWSPSLCTSTMSSFGSGSIQLGPCGGRGRDAPSRASAAARPIEPSERRASAVAVGLRQVGRMGAEPAGDRIPRPAAPGPAGGSGDRMVGSSRPGLLQAQQQGPRAAAVPPAP